MSFASHPDSRGERLFLSIEDRFLILQLADDQAMLPGSDRATNLASAMSRHFPNYQLVCDCRHLNQMTSDVDYLVEELHQYGNSPIFLSFDANPAWSRDRRMANVFPVKARDTPVQYLEVPVFPFSDDWDVHPSSFYYSDVDSMLYDFLSIDPRSEEGKQLFAQGTGPDEAIESARFEVIRRLVSESATNSLLTHVQVTLEQDQISVVPYHGNASYSVSAGSHLLLASPSAIAKRTQAILASELREFEGLLNDSAVKELDLQHFLENHPSLIRALGYGEVFSQVLLERDDGTGLRPDFLAQPVGSDWLDIIELKLPSPRVVVGRSNRKSLAANIHAMVAQLREYAAFFENELWAQRVEEEFGLRCYRPKLVGIVGRDPSGVSQDRELRRTMTAYADVEIVTFDRLLRIAQDRLLI